jgi:fumarate reductase subunit D
MARIARMALILFLFLLLIAGVNSDAMGIDVMACLILFMAALFIFLVVADPMGFHKLHRAELALQENGVKTRYVYVISDGNRVKIGKTTTDPQKRLSTLQTGNPRKLELLHQFECRNPDRLEKYLHKLFASKRERGEWFRLEELDKKILAGLDPKAFDDT